MGAAEKARRLENQVFGGGKQHLFLAALINLARNAAEHELRVQPVAAFLEVTAIRHLGEDVGAAEQVAEQAQLRIHLYVLHRNFIAGEMHDAAGCRREFGQADFGQIPGHEIGAAADMGPGVFGAMTFVGIANPAQITDVVEQRAHHAYQETGFADGLTSGSHHAPGHQPCHRQRDLKHMLHVVVVGLAAVVSGKFAAIQAADIGKDPHHAGRKLASVGGLVNLGNVDRHRQRTGRIDLVGHIVFGAAVTRL